MAKIFLELITMFCERCGKKFLSPIFCCTLNAGYQAKMVSWLRFSLNWLPFFVIERHGNKFLSPIFCCTLNAGYQALHLQDDRHCTQKKNTLNKCSKLDFISVSLLVIHCRGTHMQGTCSQEFIPNFSFSWFRLCDMVQILNDYICIT